MDNLYGKLEDLRELLNVDENAKLFYEQINNEDEDYTSPKVDHFSELYQDYSEIFEDTTIPADDLTPIVDQFTQICCHIINYINDEFNTDLEINSIMDSSHNLPGITKAMYRFFIIEFYNNILSIMKNYVSKNSSTLYENFSELSQKKDVMTGYFKKGLSEEMSTIAANIYDVTDFIFTKLDASMALDYCDKDNLAAAVLKKLLEEGNISEDFLTAIADVYKNNVNLRSRICFEIVFAIKNEEIGSSENTPQDD